MAEVQNNIDTKPIEEKVLSLKPTPLDTFDYEREAAPIPERAEVEPIAPEPAAFDIDGYVEEWNTTQPMERQADNMDQADQAILT